MSNKNTLQEYNERLGTNNITLDSILETINNLPEAGEGGTPEIKPRYIHLIKDGVEQAGNTGGIQIRVTTGNAAQGQMFNGDGYLGLGAQVWSDVEFNIPNKFDLTEYTIAVVEWAYPKASSPYARQNAVAKLAINPYPSDNRESVILTSNGATVARRKDTYIIKKATGDDSIAFHLSNTFDTSSETPVTAYPVQIFNLYLENPNANVQEKIVEINENGTTIVSPDEGYAALNSVEINVDVESNLQDKDVEINENGVTTVTADEGFDGLNSVDITINVPTNETPVINNAIDIIRNGAENTNLTGGHTYESIAGDGANFKEIQNNGYVTLTAKQWNRCWWKTVDKIDFKPFKTCKICVDYSADKLSDTDASVYEWGVVLCESETTIKLDHKPIADGVGTFTRNVCEIDITDILPILHEEYFVLQVANLTAQNSYTKYGVNFYNVWLEGEVDTEDMIVNITENGTTLITPGEGYRALNSVEVNVNVGSGEETERAYIIDNVDSSGNITELTIMGLNEIPKYFGIENPIFKKLKKVKLLEPATSIGLQAFNQATQLESITLPSTLTTINAAAFQNCTSLILTELPESVTTLSGSSNFGSSNVLLKKLPDNLKGTIPVAAFYNTPISIKKISDGVTTIEGRSFYSCDNIQQISMKNVTTMTDATQIGAFTECVNLKSVWIGSAISSMSDTTFKMCSNLNKIYIDKPRTTVEALTYYSTKWSGSTVSSTCEIICNDDVGFITQDEFDAIDWATYSE